MLDVIFLHKYLMLNIPVDCSQESSMKTISDGLDLLRED